jgi:uncharacterized protein YbdZ (MbtH family)
MHAGAFNFIDWAVDIREGVNVDIAGDAADCYELHNVASVNSVWRQCIEEPEKWKYVHDYSEEEDA